MICGTCSWWTDSSQLIPVDPPVPVRSPICDVPPPRLDATPFRSWQPGWMTTALNTTGAGHLTDRCIVRLGHGSASSMHATYPLLLQVSSFRGTSCFSSSSSRCVIAVSCPTEWIEVLKRSLAPSHSLCSRLFSLLLMLSGDVESIPGPPTTRSGAESSHTLVSALEAIQALETTQAVLLADLKILKEKQAASDITIGKLKAKLAALESSIGTNIVPETNVPNTALCDLTTKVAALESSIASRSAAEPGNAVAPSSDISQQLAAITSRCEDAENRLRRSNLLFFGIEDDQKEKWAASELKVIKFCSEKLQISTNSAQFERVHRLGKYVEGKNRPIIAKTNIL
ncbi:hypothetical protein HPB48_008372 [Haemaphysalis longicornis]|uniref:Uncharacterized protein n=1 Tax=Haemaphysalis longicornis TaxID=44386 RepID=A0A9J6FQQ8_HAELO|nr:hypothetical protein HPB48_008372 [Haemaphysalis longicornis]